MNIGACFSYRETSHMVKDCPKRRNNAASTQTEESQKKRPRAQGLGFVIA